LIWESAARPRFLAATESWPPNIEIAKRNLALLGASVIEVADDAGLPFIAETFDLVGEPAPDSCQVGRGRARPSDPGETISRSRLGLASNRELTDFMMGPQPAAERVCADHPPCRY
jgi:hypothetical protein